MMIHDNNDSFDGLWKEPELYSEHIYDCSFEEIIKKGYNPEDEKQRVDIYHPPILIHKLRMSIPKKYVISKTQNMVFGTKLGVSILQHDERIKEIINKTGECFDDLNEFQYRRLNTIQKYTYATPTMETRLSLPGLEWVIEFIRDSHENIGMTIDQLYIECYFLGIITASKLSDKIKPEINKEITKFWAAIDDRLSCIR